jgi:hypothetical protein
MSLANDPEHIAISKSGGIKIDWKDGHHSEYGLVYLRDKCPCAACTGAHGTPPRQAGSRQSLSDVQTGIEDVGRGTGGQLRHPHQLERRPQLRHLLLGPLAPHLSLRRTYRRAYRPPSGLIRNFVGIGSL